MAVTTTAATGGSGPTATQANSAPGRFGGRSGLVGSEALWAIFASLGAVVVGAGALAL